ECGERVAALRRRVRDTQKGPFVLVAMKEQPGERQALWQAVVRAERSVIALKPLPPLRFAQPVEEGGTRVTTRDPRLYELSVPGNHKQVRQAVSRVTVGVDGGRVLVVRQHQVGQVCRNYICHISAELEAVVLEVFLNVFHLR